MHSLLLLALIFFAKALPCPNNWTSIDWTTLPNSTCTLNQTIDVVSSIDLSGAVIECLGNVSIRVTGLDITLNNLTLINCYTIYYLSPEGTFILNNSRIINAFSGITAEGNVVVVNSIFQDCHTSGQGGGIFSPKNVTAINSQFESCSANDGGGIYAANITAMKTIFRNCTGHGGGIYSTHNVLVQECLFESCRCLDMNGLTGRGGAISIYTNQTSQSVVECSTFRDCSAFSYGTIFGTSTMPSTINISRVDFYNNGGLALMSGGVQLRIYLKTWYSTQASESFGSLIINDFNLPQPINCSASSQLSSQLFSGSSQNSSKSSSQNVSNSSSQSSQNVSNSSSQNTQITVSPLTSLIWDEYMIITEPTTVNITLQVNSLTVRLPSHWSGSFIRGPSIKLSGTLYLDLTELDSSFEGVITLFDAAAEGSFDQLVLIGSNSCSTAELGTAGEIFVINTCSTDGTNDVHIF
jgi:hypothetical protein